MISRTSENSTVVKHRVDKDAMLSAVGKFSRILIVLGVALFLAQFIKFSKPLPIPAASLVTNNEFAPHPKTLTITSLNIDAAVEELNLNSDGTLAVPKKDMDVGWFVGSPVPGLVGPAVMVGHLDSILGAAIFYNLKKIKIGDEVSVLRDDGSTAVFKVDKMETYSQDNFPTDKVYGAINYSGLRLITCSGTYSRLKGHYSDNLVVYATLVKIQNKL